MDNVFSASSEQRSVPVRRVEEQSSAGTRWRRIGRRLVIVAAFLLALVLVAAVVNSALEKAERGAVPAYGQHVQVGGGQVNVYSHGTTGPTIVMLGGYLTPAPAVDFAPLIRELGDFRVVVVEGFGYGYSDNNAPPRTIENITNELHQTLSALHLQKPYILLGHSIAGIYDLYYANHYPEEIAAIVGIDASVPGQINGLAGQGSAWKRLIATSGLLRAASSMVPSLVEPGGNAYTSRERERIRLMTNWNWANPAILDEANQSERNFSLVKDMTYPHHVPLLSFIKKEGNQPGWRHMHQAQVENSAHGELVELDGGHYLHWTQAPALAQTIRSFISDLAVAR